MFSIIIIKSNYHFLFALSLGVTIIMSVILAAYTNVNAQTLQTITQQRKSLENSPQIIVGHVPDHIQINNAINKIFVTNKWSNSVSVIDSNSGALKSIDVSANPYSITYDVYSGKIYVANLASIVTVIDGYNDNKIKDINVGKEPTAIAATATGFNDIKIYVANYGSNTVSVINGTTDTKEPHDILVGIEPDAIAFDSDTNKIYVANYGNRTVSVINGNTDTKVKDIPIGMQPFDIAVGNGKIYVANYGNRTVSVINGNTDTKVKDIPVGMQPFDIAVGNGKIYVANNGNRTVSVINGNTDTKVKDIPVGIGPMDEAVGNGKIYVANNQSGTVSVINGTTDTKEVHDIPVGMQPGEIAFDSDTNMIYVANRASNTFSVIDGASDKVAAGVIFNLNPASSGQIRCNNEVYPTNTYLYVDNGTNCLAQPNKDFGFNTWVYSPLSNRNSTIPLQSNSSGNLTVNRYGVFTVNFRPLPPPIPPEYLFLIITVIVTSIIGWSWTSIVGFVKARTERKHLKECMNQIGKLDKNAIEEKIIGYYVNGKISEDHRQLLKDKISEYYENEKSSAPFR